jgi:tetratricopeptide (TPR) repeat protein
MSGTDTVAEIGRAVDIRSGAHPADGADDATEAFDPREVVRGAFAREFAARLVDAGPPGGFQGTRGLERLGASDYPAAIAAFEALLGAMPPPDKLIAGPAAFLLGWAYHGAGDDRQAISAWRRAAFVDPTIVPAHLALADMYVRLSQPALAVQALRAGLAAVPQSRELRDRLSRIEGQ